MMAKSNDPLIESLMQMAVAAAPLIRKARESGIFRDRDTVVDAEIVTPEAPKPPEPPKAAEPPPVSPDTSALQDIVVRQALRINELEAEVAALKAAKKAGPKAKPKVRPAKA
ncbi:MAG: hypothetical protein B7Y82_13980 [Sphingomonadales bacterium 32-65-25]|nr:MAG: hypothetical protein B7Y82_13980 [Sphingomonadales bacterium 32-65-25]